LTFHEHVAERAPGDNVDANVQSNTPLVSTTRFANAHGRQLDERRSSVRDLPTAR
jgi:hypothetical protein